MAAARASEVGNTTVIRPRAMQTMLLIQRLEKVPVGETVGYDELSRVCGEDVQGGGYLYLNSARRRVKVDHGIWFATLRGVGLKRLDDDEKVGDVSNTVSRLNLHAKRVARDTTGIVYDNLSNERRVELNTQRAMLGAVAHFSSLSSAKAITTVVQKNEGRLPTLQDMMKHFRKEE